MKLEQEEIDMLLSDPGYGNPKTAKVIFLGNEPGAGGKGVEIAIQDRMNFLKGIPPQSKEPVEERPIKKSKSPFLQFMARVELHLKQPDLDWFQLFPDCDKEVYEKIHAQAHNFLEEPFMLIDLRPLPRPTEKTWPYSNEEIKKGKYIRAFKKFQDPTTPIFDLWRQKRIAFLKNLFTIETPELNYIIAIGDVNAKKSFFEAVFPGLLFEEIDIGKKKNGKPKLIYKAITQNENKCITVLISDFFDHGWGIQLDGLKMLANLVKINNAL